MISLLSKGLSSLLQHHCGIASVLWCSSFFMVQLSHPYMTAGKTIALTISVSQSSCSVMSNSMQPHESQHARPPCPSLTPGLYPTQVDRVSDTIQPSHLLSSPSPAPNPSQHQGLFQRVNSSHELAKVFEFQLQHQSFQ